MPLYLGNAIDSRVEVSLKTLLRHFTCLGSSGSGKTVACKVLCEEMVRAGIPVIAVDPQGDIASLALMGDEKDLESRGLADVLKDYRSKAEVLVFTPASSLGLPICLNPLQFDVKRLRGERFLKTIQTTAASIAGLLNYDPDSDAGRYATAFFNMVLEHIVRADEPVTSFSELADFLADLPEDLRKNTERVVSNRLQAEIQQKVNVLTVGANRLLFETGTPLDIDLLLGKAGVKSPAGKTRISVIYLNTLSTQAEKEFFMAELALRLYQWMLKSPSSEPQVFFYMDEAAPYLPPVRKPACKDALKMLFKQARKYGVSCCVATQNPGDLDYKCLSQFATWNLGRIPVKQDLKKVNSFIKGIAPNEVENIEATLPGLEAGNFVLLAPDEWREARRFSVRWLVTRHQTLDEDAIGELVPDELRKRFETAPPPSKPPTRPEPLVQKKENPAVPEANIAPPPEKPVREDPSEKVLEAIERLRRVVTMDDLEAETGLSTRVISSALTVLEKTRGIKKGKVGRKNAYWPEAAGYRPDLGLDRPVEAAIVQHDGPSIRKALEKMFKKGPFGRGATILESRFEHVPLYRVDFEGISEKGRFLIIFRKRENKRESIYLTIDDLKVCTVDRNEGIRFLELPDGQAADLVDLDDVCRFQTVFPAHVEYLPARLKKATPVNLVETRIASRFGVRVSRVHLVFLPCWFFKVQPSDGKRPQTVAMDAATKSRVEF